MRSDWRAKRAQKLLAHEALPLSALLHIREVFQLPAGEARAIGWLAAGYTIPEIAVEMKITEGTCRTYVKHALQHTYTHSQAQLVRLMYRAARDFVA